MAVDLPANPSGKLTPTLLHCRDYDPCDYDPRGYDPRGYDPRGYGPRG